MSLDDVVPYFIGAIFVAFALYFIVNAVRYGGLKAAMFGARIQKTLGEIDLGTNGPVRTKIRVHLLDDSSGKAVGLELVSKTLASWHMTPVTLGRSEASRLSRLLESAASSERSAVSTGA